MSVVITAQATQDARDTKREKRVPALRRFTAEADVQRHELAVLLRAIKTMVRESP